MIDFGKCIPQYHFDTLRIAHKQPECIIERTNSAYNEEDWEYPGADDRGGTEKDGENYAMLLKELRAAIKASGRDYIVTFTAPTSYWYLRHFDLENMVPHVDWVNLMSYDLHGVWDGNNTIGKQVLAHTNLTEIDLSLDLVSRRVKSMGLCKVTDPFW